MDLDFLQTLDVQLLVGGGVALLAIVIGAAYLFSSRKPKGCLDPENFKEFKLVKRVKLSHNVAKFTFALPTPTSVLGLPIGQHLSCRCIHKEGCHTISVSEGWRSSCCEGTPRVDSSINPVKLEPLGCFRRHWHHSNVPIMEVARAILENPKEKTKFHLIYANVTRGHSFKGIQTSISLLFSEELDGLAAKYPDRFKVYYVLNQDLNLISITYIDLNSHRSMGRWCWLCFKEMIQEHCPAPAHDVQILRCGPPPMNKARGCSP
ncbi:hypothetical protein EZV62_007715 [Acer yangbiense]|uniref:Uncharacterized protein n=1 Tax=Acer yangbiense TaxID=1000413 RepID=A0A5C7IAS2_9ROSI|nr:hypothetical protein EZV62_007715 [Acer yangbiense]